VALEARNLLGDADELVGEDDDGRLGEVFDEDGVVDTPRRARSSIAQADDADVDQT
jgi:hypothetical protein